MSPVKLGVTVACHPSRTRLVGNLVDALRHEGTDVTLTWDERNEEWDTHARAWRAGLATDSTHWLVLQDDAVPCRDLEAGVVRAIKHAGTDRILSLYFGFHSAYRGKAPRYHRAVAAAKTARELGASWMSAPGTWWGVAVMMPVQYIEPMLSFCDGRPEVYDTRMGRWIEHAGVGPVLYPWPSLVDHADEKSLVWKSQPPGRRAHQFLGWDRSAVTDWDMSGPVVSV